MVEIYQFDTPNSLDPAWFTTARGPRDSSRVYEWPNPDFRPTFCIKFDDEHPVSLFDYTDETDFCCEDRPVDVMFGIGIVFVKEHVAEDLLAAGLTGIEAKEARLYSDETLTKRVEGYVKLDISGRVPLDLNACGIRHIKTCPVCGIETWTPWNEWKQCSFLETAPLPDFFRTSQGLTLTNFVSPRAAEYLSQKNWKFFSLVRLEDDQPRPYPDF